MVHALGEKESVCQRQELGWYRGIFVPDTFKGNVSGIFYLIGISYQIKKHFVQNRTAAVWNYAANAARSRILSGVIGKRMSYNIKTRRRTAPGLCTGQKTVF